MARWVRDRRRTSASVSVLILTLATLSTAALTGAFSGASGAPALKLDRKQVAEHILKTKAAGLMTAPAQAALHLIAAGDKQLAPGLLPHGPSRLASGGAAPPAPGFSNVRVNDPSLDTHQVDQTTQSETAIAVAGSKVAFTATRVSLYTGTRPRETARCPCLVPGPGKGST